MSMFERNKDFYSDEEQFILKNSIVLQFGVGGIGCVTAELLVRSGVGTLILVDGDSYDVTNLNRQLGATQLTLGINKAEAMADRLRIINPDANIIVVPQFLNTDWEEIIPTTNININSVDIILSAVDGPENRLLVSNYSQKYNIKSVFGRVYMYNYWVAVVDRNRHISDYERNPQYGTKPIVNQCVLFMCSSMMALFVCHILIGRTKGSNFVYKYLHKNKSLTRENF